ncbi:MAG: 30S ribosomal protein S16, partial [Bacteroidales bacterium]|nr:30S ribosomal protein S16 [Bacteroidales bacterium]
MAVKIRLARKGRKKLAHYHIVVADSRSPRDGRYIEKIGSYNPITNPATIELDFDKALGWLQKGALPTDTFRAILSYKGVLVRKHLLEGVKKGAFDEAEADRRFEEWMKQNEAKIDAKKSGLEKTKEDEIAKKLVAEKRINEARAAKLAKKQAELAAQILAESQPETETEEVSVEEAVVETVSAEAAPEASVEAASEAAPGTAAPEASPAEAAPEASAEAAPEASAEAAPEASIEAAPEASIEAAPEASPAEAAPEASTNETTPETTSGEKP